MLDIFSKLAELIAPTRPEIKFIRNENEQEFTRLFSPHRVGDIISLSDYSNQIIKSTITANKFYDFEKASLLLAQLVKRWLETVPARETVFVPIPLSPKRLHSRGYNQVARVLTHIKGEDLMVMQILARTKETLPQTELTRERRFENVAEAFTFIHYPDLPTSARIVLIDDVITTGATMHSAKQVLQENLPKHTEIISLALAH